MNCRICKKPTEDLFCSEECELYDKLLEQTFCEGIQTGIIEDVKMIQPKSGGKAVKFEVRIQGRTMPFYLHLVRSNGEGSISGRTRLNQILRELNKPHFTSESQLAELIGEQISVHVATRRYYDDKKYKILT